MNPNTINHIKAHNDLWRYLESLGYHSGTTNGSDNGECAIVYGNAPYHRIVGYVCRDLTIKWIDKLPPEQSCIKVLTKAGHIYRAFFSTTNGKPCYKSFGEDISDKVADWLPAEIDTAEPWNKLIRL